ncbi:MAG: hypothetical protein A2X23_06590 [Chloroflexi bacterium GWC2_73_18]|nr:MAG: hypothetical protein A2X23_06590 [Chloroflexi bacterium GWC2_73_18]
MGAEAAANPTLAWRDVARLLRERGLRLTPQRRAVVVALSEFEGHVSAARLVERCLERDPDCVPSTVYRTLDLLEELGLVTHSHGADGHEEYHPAPTSPHAHLICRSCGARREANAAELGEFVAHLSREHGFLVDLSHLAVFGLCSRCAEG